MVLKQCRMAFFSVLYGEMLFGTIGYKELIGGKKETGVSSSPSVIGSFAISQLTVLSQSVAKCWSMSNFDLIPAV